MIAAVLLALLASCAPPAVAPPEAAAESTAPEQAPVTTHPWIDAPARTVDVDGTELYLLDTGGDGPPVLLVHGLGATLSFWEYQLGGDLAEDHRLIAVDLPGWGRSDQPDGPYTPSWYAEHLVGVLDALDLDAAHVAGHSMGGQAALTLALEHPERVDRLILSAPAGIETFSAEEGAILRAFWTEEKLRDRTDEEHRAAFDLVFGTWDEGVDRIYAERRAVDGTDRFPGMARAVMRSVAGMLDEPVHDRLGEVEVPTLVVFGTADQMIPAVALHPDLTPEAVGREAERRVPDATLVLIEGAGHTPHHDDPAAFDTAVRAFLADGDGGP